jgi:ABC-type multidrug transport system fused ATPase/permease subunit
MERDPVRFVWGAAPTLNAILMVLALLAVPGLWMLLDLIRAAIDDGALGRPFLHGGTAPFLRFVIPLPGRMADGPLVLVPGLALSRTGIVQGLGAALLAAALGTGLLLVTSTLIRAEIGRRALGRVEERILDGIALAPTAATDGARRAALLAGDSLLRTSSFLGRAIGTPILAGGLLLGCLVFLALLDIRLTGASALGLALFALATDARRALEARIEAADLAANDTLRRSLAELAEHLPAVAAHGTASSERNRILSDLAPTRLPGRTLRQRYAVALGTSVSLVFATVAGVLGLGASLGLSGRLSPGQVAAGTAAAACAVGALDRLLRWRSERRDAEPVFEAIARQLGSFNARRRERPAGDLPAAGILAANGVAADGPLPGGRLAGLDLSLVLPSHVALLGGPDSGARTFAGLLGGQLQARAGDLTLGGSSISHADPAARATRLAFAGGETLLLANTLRANLLYGCSDADAPGIDARLMSALEVAGLDGFVYRRGLAGVIDTRREPDLATAIVDARANMRAELDRSGLASLVQPFNPERYNPHATIGENILFGVALGDTFREENLAAHPFTRSLLDREGLTKPLAELGAAIAKSTLEMFSGLPSGSTITGRFSLLPGAEQEEFGAILARQASSRRGTSATRDAARLIGLALRYIESRHRLGLLGPELEEGVLRVRRAFAREIPKSLEPSIELFRPDRLCAATTCVGQPSLRSRRPGPGGREVARVRCRPARAREPRSHGGGHAGRAADPDRPCRKRALPGRERRDRPRSLPCAQSRQPDRGARARRPAGAGRACAPAAPDRGHGRARSAGRRAGAPRQGGQTLRRGGRLQGRQGRGAAEPTP